METKQEMYRAGVGLLNLFCQHNAIPLPDIISLTKESRYYHLKTCGFYRPYRLNHDEENRDGEELKRIERPTIWIMVEKCAAKGMAGRQWSWPGYVVDRTPVGVLAHELGHHVDHLFSDRTKKTFQEGLYSYLVWEKSNREEPITSYLGTDKETTTYYKEWFAEIFRVYVTNPDLCKHLRPGFYNAIFSNLQPVISGDWREAMNNAPERQLDAALKKIQQANSKLLKVRS